MTDPGTIVWQARQGPVPAEWRVFTKRRGKLSGFFHGTSHDPDPLLVVTRDGLIEYEDEESPLTIVNFHELAGMELKVTGQTTSSSSSVSVFVWVELEYHDGEKGKWQSKRFGYELPAIQALLEAYGVHKALLGR